jgi:predicted house-cleaning noncanonical NTP pyrophosphatase (MazG superfamily)
MKLMEESKEMAENPCMEELADILEVIEAIKDLYNFKDEDIERIKAEKKANRGGFNKRLILEKVYEKEEL